MSLSDNRFGFRGYWWDDHLKLYHVRHRVYDPASFRWLQPDPAGYVDGLNLYAYCGGDPVNRCDALGRSWLTSGVRNWIFNVKNIWGRTDEIDGQKLHDIVSAQDERLQAFTNKQVMGTNTPTLAAGYNTAGNGTFTAGWGVVTTEARDGAFSVMVTYVAAPFGATSSGASSEVFAAGVQAEARCAADAARVLTKAEAQAFKSEPNSAEFWSGYTESVRSGDVADQLATAEGRQSLDQFAKSKGIKLPEWDRNNPVVVQAWKEASRAYAEGASGSVTVVLGKNVDPESIWATIEYPALKANKNVTEIIAIDPATGARTIIFKR